MKYALMVPLLMLFVYMLSFAAHNWKQKNRLAAVGIVLIGLAAVAFPVYLMFIGKYET